MSSTTPAFPVRAFMLDISRDRVPTRETLQLYVELLAAVGYNQLELYTEHTFAHEGQEEVWKDASPVTADDMRWLDGLCHDNGIELVANRNGLGHMERFLKTELHRHRAEIPEGYEMWGQHWPASTVSYTDDNLEFVKGLYEELVGTTTAKAVNIGMDEPWEFGQGVSKELVAREGTGKAYTDWVLDVAKPWLDKGYRVEMWGDILGHHPEQAERLPEGLALVLWGYDSPEYIRRTRERAGMETTGRPGFGNMSEPFASRGKDVWVAPGTGVWLSTCGRLDCAVGNILDAVEVGVELGAGGFILTSWGDNGHWEGPLQTLVPVIVGGLATADAKDAGRLTDRDELVRVTGKVLFGDEEAPGAELLVGLGMLTSVLDTPVGNQTLVYQSLFRATPETQAPSANISLLRAEVARLRGLAGELEPAGWVDEVRTVLSLVEIACDRLSGTPHTIPGELVAEQRRNWLATSRPGGLEDSIAKAYDLEIPEPGEPVVSEGDEEAARRYWHGILGR